jgi:hypothetical protein
MAKFGFGLKISQKLPLIIVAGALITGVAVGMTGYLQSESALEASAFEKLEAVQEGRISELEAYLGSIREDLTAVAASHMTIDALEEFQGGWDLFGSRVTETLQRLYIRDNPNPLGEKHKLTAANDGSPYSEVHAKYHTWFRNFLEARGYYDVFLVSHEGDVVYTVFKELDYGTNLNTGQWKDTDLAKVYRAVEDNFRQGFVAFTDFAPYAPSNDAPASFIAIPVFDHEGGKHGVLVFQMPIGRINAIMQAKAGMGETGETYLVGKDFLMRSDSRFSEESTILKSKVDTEPVRRALEGEDSVLVAHDYRGVEVLSAYGPMEFNGVTWAVMAEIDMEEVEIPSSACWASSWRGPCRGRCRS